MAWEHDLKKIYQREWDNIQSNWLANIPQIEYPGQPPIIKLNEIVDIEQLYTKTKENKGTYNYEQNAIRCEIIREAIFYAHKSIHICCTAISHLENGILSWGNSSAYQSSYYSIKSILSFLGLSFLRIHNKTLVIDCFPELEKLSNRERKLNLSPKSDMKFIIFDDLSHMQYWEIFQRVIRVTNCKLFSNEIKLFINNITSKDFVIERNNLHYTCNYWPSNNDLFNLVFDKNYGFKSDLLFKLNEVSVTNRDFLFLINYVLIYINMGIIKSLSELSQIVTYEYELLNKTLKVMPSQRFINSIDIEKIQL